jgi:hypothetical protein
MTQQIKQARDALLKLNPQHGVPVTDEQMDEYEHACTTFIILNYDTILDLLDKEIDGGWEPIETAPKDGTPILGYRYGQEYKPIGVIFWADNTWSVQPSRDLIFLLHTQNKMLDHSSTYPPS